MQQYPASVHAYAAAHPRCEVYGCNRPPMPTPHHLKKVLLGGTHDSSNLLRLCFTHHIGDHGWHTMGPVRWIYRHWERLTAGAFAKCVRALNGRQLAALESAGVLEQVRRLARATPGR